MYSIFDIHYNSKGVVQVSPEECFEDLAATLKSIESELKTGSELEQNMLSFFQKEVEPMIAYRDNNVNQGKSGPRTLFSAGYLKKIPREIGLLVRLGISAPGENPLIPSLQALYLMTGKHRRYFEGVPIGSERDPDKWAYEFTDRYQGMIKGVHVRTRLGINSIQIISAINEAILNPDKGLLEAPKYG